MLTGSPLTSTKYRNIYGSFPVSIVWVVPSAVTVVVISWP